MNEALWPEPDCHSEEDGWLGQYALGRRPPPSPSRSCIDRTAPGSTRRGRLVLRIVKPRQGAGAVGEALNGGADAVEHRHVEVAERRVLGVHEVPSGRKRTAGAAGEHGRQVVRIVSVA